MWETRFSHYRITAVHLEHNSAKGEISEKKSQSYTNVNETGTWLNMCS